MNPTCLFISLSRTNFWIVKFLFDGEAAVHGNGSSAWAELKPEKNKIEKKYPA